MCRELFGGSKGSGLIRKSLEQVWRDLFGDDDLDTIFSRWDPLWGKKTGRYKNKHKWRGDVEQLRPNRFGMGWQVPAPANASHVRMLTYADVC